MNNALYLLKRAGRRALTVFDNGTSKAHKAELKAKQKAALKAARKAELKAGKAIAEGSRRAAPNEIPTIADIPTAISLSSTSVTPKDQFREYRGLAKRYSQLISEATALHDHRSLTPGRSDWAEKWVNCEGKRILFFTVTDYSGSFYKWAEAVNRHTPHAVRMVSLFRHRYGYPLDILSMRGDLLVSRFPDVLNELLKLIDEADIIHLKDQDGFWRGRNSLPKTLLTQFRKPMVYTLYGGTARKDETDIGFQRYVASHDAIIAMTPDLCFDWNESVFIPHNIDEDLYPFRWEDGSLIMHTPSSPHRKGTEFFRPAAERLALEVSGRVEVITGTKHEYIMRHKPNATIFFDQAGRETEENGGKLIGWYGNSALEAAVFGVPTMAHLSEEAIERALRSGYDVSKHSGLLNVAPNEEGIYRTMREFFDRSAEERKQVANRTRKWIEEHHSYRSTAAKLSAVYEKL
ncbi:glycosyltransferase [Pseudaminobacter salicylatoxidans]|uniref:glycosyltransferase n=1 Tax=Pseudaminobacter salicylatoxidans TaxID=93369 RepID=UPI00047527F7|nr:hypothetical protein [Pseudaminobacter salicylatoxidans]